MLCSCRHLLRVLQAKAPPQQVFLARLNGFGAIAYVFLFSALTIGGESAARRLGVPSFFSLVIVALLLITLGLAEYSDKRRRARARH